MTSGDASDSLVLIQTNLQDPIPISLFESLLSEAHIPFVPLEQSRAVREASGTQFAGRGFLVPQANEAEAGEILASILDLS